MTVEEGPRTLTRVLRTLDDADLTPDGLTVREPSFDDVFLTLTGHRAESDGDATDDDLSVRELVTTRGAA